MNPIYFLMFSFAIWRVTYMFVFEEGPYKAVERFRNAIINYPWSPIHCFKCTSIWIGFLFSFLMTHDWQFFLIVWFSGSAVSIFIQLIWDNYNAV